MSLTATLVLLAASLAVVGLANWRERQPKQLAKTSLFSYPLIQMVGLVIAILMVAHLISLMTGHQLQGRRFP
jgi:uncharacterized membrane protein YidH (DUF202 family)